MQLTRQVIQQLPAECGDVAEGLRDRSLGNGARSGGFAANGVVADPVAQRLKVKDLNVVVGDSLACPRCFEAAIGPVGGQSRSGVVAEKLVAQAVDEAHGDRFGHEMRVFP